MPCKTCSHTMQQAAPGIFWCPRCGSLLIRTGEHECHEPPMLVGRVEKLCDRFRDDLDYEPTAKEYLDLARRLGILESISDHEARAT